MTDRIEIPIAYVGVFDHGGLDKSVQATVTTADNQKWNFSCFGTNRAMSGFHLCRSHLLLLLRSLSWLKSSDLWLEFSRYLS